MHARGPTRPDQNEDSPARLAVFVAVCGAAPLGRMSDVGAVRVSPVARGEKERRRERERGRKKRVRERERERERGKERESAHTPRDSTVLISD